MIEISVWGCFPRFSVTLWNVCSFEFASMKRGHHSLPDRPLVALNCWGLPVWKGIRLSCLSKPVGLRNAIREFENTHWTGKYHWDCHAFRRKLPVSRTLPACLQLSLKQHLPHQTWVNSDLSEKAESKKAKTAAKEVTVESNVWSQNMLSRSDGASTKVAINWNRFVLFFHCKDDHVCLLVTKSWRGVF